MSPEQSKPSTLLDVVDTETREGIMRLHKKLKGIQAEITSKLEFLPDNEKAGDLNLLSSEIDKALLSINNLIKTKIAEDVSTAEFLESNQEAIDQFRDMIKTNTAKLSELGEKI